MKLILTIAFLYSFLYAQYDYSLEDLNSSSDHYGDLVGTSYFTNKITLHYFGHFTWGTCAVRFEQLNDLHDNLELSGTPTALVGIGKNSHVNSVSNWTENNNAPVCADPTPFQVWEDWGAYQRDLFITDFNDELVYRENITSGIPDSLENFIISLNQLSISESIIPKKISLSQNFPNPFNPTTNIKYQINKPADIKITVYNLKGEVIRNLISKNEKVGFNLISWNGEDNYGAKVSSGTYIYKIETPEFSDSRKMVLLK